MEWWEHLSSIQHALWAIATFASVLLVLQVSLAFLGLDHHAGFEHDQDNANASDTAHDGQPGSHHIPMLRFFTIRDAVAFLTGVGWGGLMLISWGLPEWVAVLGGLTIGISFAAVVVLLMWLLSSLASSGSVNLRNAIDRQGEVTLSIPAHGEGCGKMLLSIQGRTIEIEAFTPGNAISRGTRVRVIRLEGGGMLFVEPVVNAST